MGHNINQPQFEILSFSFIIHVNSFHVRYMILGVYIIY